MKIYFATWLYEPAQGAALTRKRAGSRLLSFHFLKKQGIKPKQLKKYCETGKLQIGKE